MDFVKGQNPWQLSSDDYRALTADAGVQPSRSDRLTRWVDSLHGLTRILTSADDPRDDDLDLFWIRLWVALNELEEQLGGAKVLRDKSAGYTWGSKMGAYVNAELEVLAATEQLLRELTGDDVIYIDYRRQCAVHMKQSAYRLSVKRDGKGGFILKTGRNFGLLDKEVSVEEAREVIRRMEVQHGGARGAALVIAQKVSSAVQRLWIAQHISSDALKAL